MFFLHCAIVVCCRDCGPLHLCHLGAANYTMDSLCRRLWPPGIYHDGICAWMRWHMEMVLRWHRNVVLRRATLLTTMFSQGRARTGAICTRAASAQEAIRTFPTKRQMIALAESSPVPVHMFRQPRRGAASANQTDESSRSRNWNQKEGIWNRCSVNSDGCCEASNVTCRCRTGICAVTKYQ